LAVKTFSGMKMIVVAKPAKAAMPRYLQRIYMQMMICSGEDQAMFRNGVKFWNI